MEETKQCNKCKLLLKVDYYHKDKAYKDGYKSTCKKCRKIHEKSGSQQKRSREQILKKQRATKFWKISKGLILYGPKEPRKTSIQQRYGVTEQDYKRILKSQEGKCGICGITEKDFIESKKGVKNIKKLFIDHDHETEEVRGLLCDKCNRGLGYLGDTKEAIEKAVKYLTK